MQVLSKTVEAGQGLGAEEAPVLAVAQLQDLCAQAEALAEQSHKLKQYQKQFGVQQTDLCIPPGLTQ